MGWFDSIGAALPKAGALAALGLGPNQGFDWTAGSPNLNSPQPVPGMPPRAFDGPVIGSGFPGGGNPNGWPTPTNGGINPQGVPKLNPDGTYSIPPPEMPMMGGGFYESGNRGSGQPISQPMGALGQLGGMGGGQMVTLRGPDGTTKAVPQSDMAHWLSRGATMAMGG